MSTREPMLDMFIFETLEMIEQLQQIIMDSEKTNKLEGAAVNEIFRIMHTIKGSSGMMMYDNISHLSHMIEDLFFYIRESKPTKIDYSSLTDLVLEGSDLIKTETEKINNDKEADGNFASFITKVQDFLHALEQVNGKKGKEKKVAPPPPPPQKYYLSNDKSNVKDNTFSAILFFEDDCDMENVRSFTAVHSLKDIAEVIYFEPEDIIENNDSSLIIKQQGFKVLFKTSSSKEEIYEFFQKTAFLKSVAIDTINDEKELEAIFSEKEAPANVCQPEIANPLDIEKASPCINQKQNLISVDVTKLDKLMDLVGELVISEAMVTKNSELRGLNLDNFYKAARQHRKRLADLQDVVMSIRMVPLAPTLSKMNRLVRDMCKKLNKEAELQIIGQDTEVDKNIIEHIGDPLMHIVRNSLDHGIESIEERIVAGKNNKGKLIIEAKNTGGEVWIIIKDDGRGLDKEKILNKAISHGLIKNNEKEMSDKDIFSLIFLPGFSTNENVTEFSGRGVGMDVVVKEIEKIRGTVSVDSVPGKGTTISMKIPLTLAIIDGMTIRVGRSAFTIPVTSIRQSYIIKGDDIINDLDKKEMVIIRDQCYSILRLHELYDIKTSVVNIDDGIVIMVEDEGKTRLIFADELIGEQQVVIKTLPDYIKKVKGVIGCTLLGDGSISLILDISEIVNL